MPKKVSTQKTFAGTRKRYSPNPLSEKLILRCQKEETTLSFDDVTLRAKYSEVGPGDVDTSSFFSERVPLKTPLVSAAMIDVTERNTAIEMAIAGGIGIIHRILSPKEQAAQVSSVKHYLNALIEDPITFGLCDAVGDVLLKKEAKEFEFSSFPIVDENSILLGLITGTHLQIYEHSKDTKLKDIMHKISEKKVVTSGPRTTINGAYKVMVRELIKTLPLVDKKGVLKGMYSHKDVARIRFGNRPMYNTDPYGRLYVGAAVGTLGDKNIEERIELLVKKGVDVIVIDNAHVNTKKGIETIKYIKKNYQGRVDIVAGNIDDPEAVDNLIEAGANGIKIGLGPGAICTTRVIAGVGTPQITAILECSKAARYRVPVCADGGIKYPGDVTKAISAGAQSVMVGSLLAGTKESPGKIVEIGGKEFKVYRGMGSKGVMEEHSESVERYSQQKEKEIISQGIESRVPYTGKKVSSIVNELRGGLRAGMSYMGAKDVVEVHQKAHLRRVTSEGKKESHPHGVKAMGDQPNYSVEQGES